MTLLTVLSNVARVIKIPVPSSAFNVGDSNVEQLVGFANEWAQEIATEYTFAELQKEYNIGVLDGVDSYALPDDFLSIIDGTEWNKTTKQRLFGALTPQEWQTIKSGMLVGGLRYEYRIKGSNPAQFYITPTPTAGNVGEIISFEYQSNTAIRPRQWAPGVNTQPSTYVSYLGHNYITVVGGTTGNSAPIHTTGVVTDGGVSWTFVGDAYPIFTADSDMTIIDELLLYYYLIWKWYEHNGFDYAKAEKAYRDRLTSIGANRKGARTISLNSRRRVLCDPCDSGGNYGL